MNWTRILSGLALGCQTAFCFADDATLNTVSSGYHEASLADQNSWNCLENPAASNKKQGIFLGIAHARPFLIRELSSQYVVFTSSLNNRQSLHFTAAQTGFSEFSIKNIKLGFSTALSPKIRAGLSLGRYSLESKDEFNKSKNSYYGQIGLLASPLDYLTFGASLENPTRSTLSGETREALAARIRIGAAVKASEVLRIFLTLSQKSDAAPSFHSAIEYNIKDKIIIRSGWESANAGFSYGTGYRYDTIQMDVTVHYHPQLGFTPSIQLAYGFK